jgi:hypothetical protein
MEVPLTLVASDGRFAAGNQTLRLVSYVSHSLPLSNNPLAKFSCHLTRKAGSLRYALSSGNRYSRWTATSKYLMHRVGQGFTRARRISPRHLSTEIDRLRTQKNSGLPSSTNCSTGTYTRLDSYDFCKPRFLPLKHPVMRKELPLPLT